MRATRRLILLAALGSVLPACTTTTKRSEQPVVSEAPTDPLASADLPSCDEPGTMAALGKSDCVPVGPKTVPEGFEPAKNDWGFHAIIPWSAECGDGVRGKLGSTKCEELDDCKAPFPPKGATLVTNDAELQAALAGTADTIALDETYYKPFEISRDVTIVGRCAKGVEISGQEMGEQGKLPGIHILGPRKVTIRSVSLHRNHWGIQLGNDADVTVEKTYFKFNDAAGLASSRGTLRVSGSLIQAAQDMMLSDGFIVSNAGHLEIDDSEFRGMHVAIDAYGKGSTAKGSRLIMTEQSKEMSALLVSSAGADVTIDRSLVMAHEKWLAGARSEDSRRPGESAPARMHIENSELIRVYPTDATGVSSEAGSSLELENDTFLTRARIAVQAEKGGILSIAHTVIRPVEKTDAAKNAVGEGIALYDDAKLTLEGSAIIGLAQAGIMAQKGSHTEVRGSLISGIWEFQRKSFDKRLDGGQAISLSGDASLDIADSTLQDNAGIAIWMGREGAGLKMSRTAILDRRPTGSTAVAGLFSWGGTIEVEDSLFHGIPDTAIALGDTIGAVSNTVLSQTPVGFRWMGASRLVESSDAARRAEFGEVLSRNVVQVDTTSPELEEKLPLGDCACSKSKDAR